MDTVDYVIKHYGMRVSIPRLAHLLGETPQHIRNEICAERFPIPTAKVNPGSKQSPRYADARDVAEYLDRTRPRVAKQASQDQDAYNA